MLLDNFLGKKVLITQIKSESGLVEKQKATLIGLGLRGINTTSQLIVSKDTLGMIKKVNHLVKISYI